MKALSMGIIGLALCSVPAFAGTVVVGLPADANNGNCYPFGCAYSGEYQQVYNSGQFSGAITITSLDFYNTAFNVGASTTNSGNFDISLSTTSADWDTLSPTFSDNIGADNTTVFNGSILQPWAFGDTLTISLTTPFTYNPADGNLLLDVIATGTGTAGGEIFFDSNGLYVPNDYLGRVYNDFGTNYTQSGYGIVTGFGEGAATTPEPSSFLLLGSGLLGAFGALRRRIKG